ncbi:hypothetical protein EOD07_06080 [Mesorhizobium sp. M2C.T.Ca.TU.002.02.1.1]|nr:hypothetical protein EOD07_06080 [Mesorhizobium sp. M2C.T.Ca.TU.002.02.1.1]
MRLLVSARRSRRLISPLVGEMSGRTEGGALERLPRWGLDGPHLRIPAKGVEKTRPGRRDSAPLCPAGHLPHLGGDWQRRRLTSPRTAPPFPARRGRRLPA